MLIYSVKALMLFIQHSISLNYQKTSLIKQIQVIRSGMLRLFTGVTSRLYFVEQFEVILEMNRVLANLTVHVDEMHELLNSEHVIAFLSDTLQYSYTFLFGIYTKPVDEKAKQEKKRKAEIERQKKEEQLVALQKAREEKFLPPLYRSTLVFKESDKAPLGLKIRWSDPPTFLGVIDGTPAQRFETSLIAESHCLLEVNGIEVQGMKQEIILELFKERPLTLYFQRTDVAAVEDESAQVLTVEDILELEEGRLAENGGRSSDVDPLSVMNNQIARDLGVDMDPLDSQADDFGMGKGLKDIGVDQNNSDSMKQYLECFHLCLLSIHNLSCTLNCHQVILAEPKVLDFLSELVSSEVISADLRRIVFSTLCNLARQHHVAGKILKTVTSYYMDHESIDVSLEK